MKLTGEKTEVLGEKPVPVPLCRPQIPHGLNPGSNPGLCGERPATNRLSHGTAVLYPLLLSIFYALRTQRRFLFPLIMLTLIFSLSYH
jgi:hypothetical protein